MKHYEALLAWVLDKHEDRALDISVHIIDAYWDDDTDAKVPDWDVVITATSREQFSHNDGFAAMAHTWQGCGATLDEAAEAVLAFMAELEASVGEPCEPDALDRRRMWGES